MVSTRNEKDFAFLIIFDSIAHLSFLRKAGRERRR